MRLSSAAQQAAENLRCYWQEQLNMLTISQPHLSYSDGRSEISISLVVSCIEPASGFPAQMPIGTERITDGCSPLADPSTLVT